MSLSWAYGKLCLFISFGYCTQQCHMVNLLKNWTIGELVIGSDHPWCCETDIIICIIDFARFQPLEAQARYTNLQQMHLRWRNLLAEILKTSCNVQYPYLNDCYLSRTIIMSWSCSSKQQMAWTCQVVNAYWGNISMAWAGHHRSRAPDAGFFGQDMCWIQHNRISMQGWGSKLSQCLKERHKDTKPELQSKEP